MTQTVTLTRSKNKTEVTIVVANIASFAWVDRFAATAINMVGGPSIWVDETPQNIRDRIEGLVI